MKASYLLNAALWLAQATAKNSRSLASGARASDRVGTGGTRKFILEVEKGSSLDSIARQHLTKPGRTGDYHRAFDCSDVFTGIVIETELDNADSLQAMEGVVNVWPARRIAKPWVDKSDETQVPPRAGFNYSIHQWTGVDKLHEAGIRGKGVTIAMLDTGIDYTHKALGGCFGHGCKVVGGYDLVGSDWDFRYKKTHPKKPDDDPMDYDGHGTHVAGIIAAKNGWLAGVAPDANLLIYKVFSDDAYETDEETIMQALCDAYNAGADVITTSIGQPNGFSDNPWAVLASRIAEKGIVVVASAGNEGEAGPFYSSSGSVGRGVIAAAAANVSSKPLGRHSHHKPSPLATYFSSWGPTNELLIKPDIAAPGYKIVSTTLNQTYESLTGTSMSAPYVAGVAALFISKYGGREYFGPDLAKMLHERIASSGKSLPWRAKVPEFKANPFQVGTGLIDAWKVVQYDTQLEYEPFALMDTVLFKPDWSFSITNGGERRRRYSFWLEPAAGLDIYDEYFGVARYYDLKARRIAPKVQLPDPISVRPGATEKLWVSFEKPQVDEDYLPLYGGKLWIESDHGERLSIPYGGAAYDTEKAFGRMFKSVPFVTNEDGDWAWSFNVDRNSTDFVELNSRLAYPCTNLRWDIFDSNWRESMWHYPPKVGQRGYIGSATSMRDTDQFWFFNPTVNDKDDTEPFPQMRVPRGFRVFWWFGKLANGTQIAPGNYTMRFAALRPYGNPHISDHWDVMENLVPNIQILPHNATKNSTMMYRRPRIRDLYSPVVAR